MSKSLVPRSAALSHALSALAVSAAFLLHVAVAQASQPRFPRLSWARSETAGTMTIAWNTNREAASQVRYGLDDTYGLIAEGTSFQAPGDLGWIHEVTLEGLEADTVYHYRVGSVAGWTDDLTFRTPPPPDGCTPFTFIALGDNRSDDNRGSSPKWGGILGEAIVDDPAFVLNTGDLVKEGQEVDQWEVFLGDTSPGAAYVPFFPSMGNHDDDSVQGDDALYNMVFALPHNEETGTEDFYWFTYGDAIFVALSTVSYEGGGAPYQQQAEWLDRVLTEQPKPWKIVFFHHPPYTGYVDLFGLDVNHPPNEKGQNEALGPIFDKHHVDLVFNGHNHFYQRFQPLQYSSANPEEGIPREDPAEGTIYAITGGAGALTYAIDLYMWGLCAFTPGAAVCNGKHHYVQVEIDGATLRYTALTTAQQLLGSDPDNVEIIDSFEIVKSGYAPNCVTPPVDEGPPVDAGPTDIHAPDAGPTDAGEPAPDVVVAPDVPEAPDVPAATDVPVAPPDEGVPSADVPAEDDVPPAAPDSGETPEDDTAKPGGSDDSAGAPDAAAPADAGGTVSESSGGGCAAAPGTSPTLPPTLLWLALLALLGLVAGLRRARD